MSKTLDIDNNIDLWLPTFDAAMKGEKIKCPLCKSSDVEYNRTIVKDNLGYAIITCNKCGKSGYLSRVKFKL